jgi:CRISPR-associated protein Cas2
VANKDRTQAEPACERMDNQRTRSCPHNYLVGYDISDPVRLRRVHRLLRSVAIPIQRSVFLVKLDQVGREQLTAKLSELIDPKADDVRLYRMTGGGRLAYQGRRPIPEGLHMESLGIEKLRTDLNSK